MKRSPATQRVWDELVESTARVNAQRAAEACRVMDAHAKGEPVRTPFDSLVPEMPPAVKLSA